MNKQCSPKFFALPPEILGNDQICQELSQGDREHKLVPVAALEVEIVTTPKAELVATPKAKPEYIRLPYLLVQE